MNKLSVQLVQLNNQYGDQVYLPYSVGMLRAYAEQFEHIKNTYSFNEFIYLRDKIETLASKTENPDVLGISCYVWNWALSIKLARRIRDQNPECLIVLGGPHVPNNIEGFFEKYPFIDIVCHGEGEATFYDILNKHSKNEDIKSIIGTTFYDRKEDKVYTNASRDRFKDINVIPSPYLNGCFEDLLKDKSYKWMATWETNRGCPFKCTFCDWGSAIATKLRRFDSDRLLREIDFFTEKKIPLVFGADANFGILKRDREFAVKLANNKKDTGYPEQFRVCFTKNTTDRVFELARIFSEAGMNKGVSVSMQSLNTETLDSIKRNNIKMSFFKDLQRKYVNAGLVTYTELILPLPDETYDSFLDGIDALLDSSQHSGLVIYNCTIMPNAEMGDKEYQEKYGLDMVEVPVLQAHSAFKKDDILEKELVVVGTKTMSRKAWKQSFEFSMAVQGMHLLGLLQAVSIILRYNSGIRYRDFYESFLAYGRANKNSIIGKELIAINNLLDGVFNGQGFDQVLPEFEEIIWPPEEALFLRVIENIDQFYHEVEDFIQSKYNIEDALLKDIITYQKNIIVHYRNKESFVFELNYNIHEYFTKCRAGVLASLDKEKSIYKCKVKKDYSEDKKLFSKEVVWYGRKGGQFLYNLSRESNNA